MITLYIKNMVCNRCIAAVQDTLEQLGLQPHHIGLGEVVIAEEKLSSDTLKKLDTALEKLGFERIDDRRARLIEAMKTKIISMIHHSQSLDIKNNWSTILAEEFHHEYNYLSSLFSSVEGITLEQYIIRQKIEKAKELLFYDELTLSQIAYRLGYSSVAHLSAQFKKITGLAPSELKKSRTIDQVRKPIDSVGN
ncbi:helix-turn-helix transcriptional regulator [Cytophagales bacterium LB-30]|uniref:Helix-turn-helix transcriptional regulator n=1 Tax=Shiella aurantiaca TaxID=3058365 RepID=A0ABT8F7G4_9BACT|nr:helix-turn-helix transcriptional regulator [Shiella aurantiaca]MDN4166184.1 helix-turn-helix transcriptional regulator [Shiella aurantiaca]